MAISLCSVFANRVYGQPLPDSSPPWIAPLPADRERRLIRRFNVSVFTLITRLFCDELLARRSKPCPKVLSGTQKSRENGYTAVVGALLVDLAMAITGCQSRPDVEDRPGRSLLKVMGALSLRETPLRPGSSTPHLALPSSWTTPLHLVRPLPTPAVFVCRSAFCPV